MATALTAKAAGVSVGYTAERVRELFRLGKFPAPIDPTLHPRSWRWAPQVIEQYVAGEWRPSPQLIRGAA